MAKHLSFLSHFVERSTWTWNVLNHILTAMEAVQVKFSFPESQVLKQQVQISLKDQIPPPRKLLFFLLSQRLFNILPIVPHKNMQKLLMTQKVLYWNAAKKPIPAFRTLTEEYFSFKLRDVTAGTSVTVLAMEILHGNKLIFQIVRTAYDWTKLSS